MTTLNSSFLIYKVGIFNSFPVYLALSISNQNVFCTEHNRIIAGFSCPPCYPFSLSHACYAAQELQSEWGNHSDRKQSDHSETYSSAPKSSFMLPASFPMMCLSLLALLLLLIQPYLLPW